MGTAHPRSFKKDFRSFEIKSKTAGRMCAPAANSKGELNQQIKLHGGAPDKESNFMFTATNLLSFEMHGVYHNQRVMHQDKMLLWW